ncbi:acyl-CoA-binding protein [Pseudotenacibaculum sp. MALMAid0570]|uniref:acyl-CoA-binding protein n=1 Tax=Pseudotenacibaculum sp. MALMAid0570 TaxID=3143938 RepID=UPI0032DE31B7
MGTNLDKEFQKAFNSISELEEGLTPDTMLKFYAYYKQATSGDTISLGGDPDIRDGFKFNAWRQLNGMSQEEAKREYISLAKEVLTLI